MQRNSSTQADGGGYDLIGLSYLAIEIKRQEVPFSESWWKQCLEQVKEGQIPVLWYRRSRQKWRIRQLGRLGGIDYLEGSVVLMAQVDVSVEDHLRWLEHKIRSDSGTQEAGH